MSARWKATIPASPAPRKDPPGTPGGTGRIPILTYHYVGDHPRPRHHRSIFCHAPVFARQMRLLHRLGWRTIPLPRVAKFLAAGVALPQKTFVLTFDDGDADLDWAVRPVLRRYGFTASAFVVTGYLGGHSDWERAEELRGRPLLSEAQLRAMADEGWDIGSHTASHPNLSAIDGEAMEREVRGARERLEEILQRAVPSFCYPSGDYDAPARAAVKAAGHMVAVTTVRGCVRAGADPLLLPRIGVSHRAGPLGLLWRIRAARAGPPRSAR